MFYIVTYATHSEKYFDSLKQYPGLIVLGFGEKWTGFHDKAIAVVEFCKKVKSDDIVCVVDGFDTLILESSDEILKRYKELDKDLVFSVGAAVDQKYFLDRVFGTCDGKRLNAGMYMGKAGSIINLLEDLKKGEDDQRYVTAKCSEGKEIFIDEDSYLFYNYSIHDKIHVRDNKLFLNDNKVNTCIISSPGNKDIGFILKELGYKNIPVVKIETDIVRRIKTYSTIFIPDILLIATIIAIFYYGGGLTSLIPYFISVLLIFIFMEFFLKTIHLPISNNRKALYTMLYTFHWTVIFIIYYLIIVLINDIIHNRCNLNLFLLSNMCLLIVTFFFLIYKRCILSIWEEKASGVERYNRIFQYFLNDKPYMHKIRNKNNTNAWMNGNIFSFFIMGLINLYILIKLLMKKCKV